MEIDLEILDRKIAALLHNYPAIWDRNSAGFKNVAMKKNSFKQMAAQLNVSAQACEDRYKSLREKFRKEKVKDQSDENYAISGQKWELYDQLSFLNDFILTRRRRVPTVKYEEFEEAPVQFTPPIQPVIPKVEVEDDPLSNDSSSIAVPSPMYFEPVAESIPAPAEPTEKTQTEDNEPPPHKKQKTVNNENHNGENHSQEDLMLMINQLVQTAQSLAKSEPTKAASSSARFDYLGKFITETLNSMKEADAEETAKEIMDLLFKKKINSIK